MCTVLRSTLHYALRVKVHSPYFYTKYKYKYQYLSTQKIECKLSA
jgi:hypothetical protein